MVAPAEPAAARPPRRLELNPTLLLEVVSRFGVNILACQEHLSDYTLDEIRGPIRVVPAEVVVQWLSGRPLSFPRDHVRPACPPDDEVWLLKAPGPSQQRVNSFVLDLLRGWEERGERFQVVVVTDLAPHIHASFAVDTTVIHRLHGGTLDRGWDVRPSRLWITFLRCQQRTESLEASVWPLAVAEYDLGREPSVDLSELVYLDAPNNSKAAGQATHAGALRHLQDMARERIGDIGPSLISSSQRVSGGSSQRAKRALHVFGVPAGLVAPDAFPFREGFYLATHSNLVRGPVFILRFSELAAADAFLQEHACESVILISSATIAVVPTARVLTLLTEDAGSIQLDEGALLQVRLGSTGATVYQKALRGGRPLVTEIRDVLRIVGVPPSWTPVEMQVFFNQLGRAGIFEGSYALERPVRPDGSQLEQIRCTCSSVHAVSRLIGLGQTTVASPGRGTAVVKFQSVGQTFQWSTAPDATWGVIANGVYWPTSQGNAP